MVRFAILYLSLFMFTDILIAQDDMDCIFAKIHSNNQIDNTLKTGFYEIIEDRVIERDDLTYQVEYIQEIDTVIIENHFLFFKRERNAIIVKSKPVINSFYIKKPFERSQIPEIVFLIDPKPLILGNNITSIELIDSCTIQLEIDEYGKNEIEKVNNKNRESLIGLIINDKVVASFNIYRFRFYSDALHINFDFRHYSKKEIENIKSELEKKD